jgi:hypothetical protein
LALIREFGHINVGYLKAKSRLTSFDYVFWSTLYQYIIIDLAQFGDGFLRVCLKQLEDILNMPAII